MARGVQHGGGMPILLALMLRAAAGGVSKHEGEEALALVSSSFEMRLAGAPQDEET
jgi:hypothetical protein